MRTFLNTILAALLVALPLAVRAADDVPTPDEPSPAAMEFVAQFSDNHLSGMLSRIGSKQQEMIALSQLHGQLVAAVFDTEIDKAVKEHSAEWQRNMARAWTPLLTDDELESLLKDGAASPASAKYQELAPDAGRRMQALSQDLFKSILAEVITNTVKSLAEPAQGDAKEPENGPEKAPETKSD